MSFDTPPNLRNANLNLPKVTPDKPPRPAQDIDLHLEKKLPADYVEQVTQKRREQVETEGSQISEAREHIQEASNEKPHETVANVQDIRLTPEQIKELKRAKEKTDQEAEKERKKNRFGKDVQMDLPKANVPDESTKEKPKSFWQKWFGKN